MYRFPFWKLKMFRNFVRNGKGFVRNVTPRNPGFAVRGAQKLQMGARRMSTMSEKNEWVGKGGEWKVRRF
jgi:hypothetical protein